MLESLKKKTLLGNLWCIIVLGIVTATLGVLFGSGIVKMLAGPAYFEPLDDHEDILSLQGQYITMDVDTLIDYYAETVRSESGKRDEVSAREYIMPINTPGATIYIGLEVPASKIDDAEAIVDDTARMLDDEDGSYEWDGSYMTVRGTRSGWTMRPSSCGRTTSSTPVSAMTTSVWRTAAPSCHWC